MKFRKSIVLFIFSEVSHIIWKKPLELRFQLRLTGSPLGFLPPSLPLGG